MDTNHAAWDAVSEKYWREYDDLLVRARAGESLVEVEREVLRPLLAARPDVVHLQSGDGIDDHALVRAGARSVVGVDYSRRAAAASADGRPTSTSPSGMSWPGSRRRRWRTRAPTSSTPARAP
jgi:hypothetical protein